MKQLHKIFDVLQLPFFLIKHLFLYTHTNIEQTKKKVLFVCVSFFIFLNGVSYAATHTYVPEEDSAITLTSLGYTDTTHDISNNAYVYYMFQLDEPGDVTITVNNIETDNVRFNYDTTDYPTPNWNNGVETIDLNNMAENDTIYLAVLDNSNVPNSYQIIVTLTPIPDSNITITKTNSADIVTVGEDFYYIMNVKNISTDTASDITVKDILPDGLTFLETETNDASPYWDCSSSSGIVTCDHNDSNLSAGETHPINLYVTAPSTAGDVENNVSVTGIINNSSHSATASETTIISADIDNAENLCYIEATPSNYATEDDLNANCEKEGNFYYGQDCTASVIIVDTNISNEDLTDVVVTKMYAPGLDHGIAQVTRGNLESTQTDTGGASTLDIVDYSSYTEGYVVRDLLADGFVNDSNFTITDIGSYNNGNQMFGIALYGDYNVSGTHHSGRIFACSGVSEGAIEILSSGDVIDTPITSDNAANYNASVVPNQTDTDLKYIRTMIAADTTREIVGVYLNLDGDTEIYTYSGALNANNGALPFQLTPLWSDSTCSTTYGNVLDAAGDRLILEIPSGSYSSPKTAITVPNYVRQDYRLQMIIVDPNSLSVEGQNCLDGSTTGNFDQLAQCVNSEVQYKTAFGQDAWDRCGMDSGAPCEPENGGAADPTDPTYDPATDYLYTNPLGCYMCTFNIQPACSTDNFAIRPKAFNANISDGDTFVSGELTNLQFEALNANNVTPTEDYNEIENSSFSVDINITDPSKTCPTTIELNPSVQFVDGIDTGDFFFNDVGKDLNFTVSEINGSEYALVDADDSNDSVRLITPFERNISVIPDRFIIEANLTDHNSDHNFTYLHDINNYDLDDNYEMAADLNITIKAMGADDNITRNYMETCYAEDTNLTLTLGSTDITYPGAVQPLTHFLYYNPAEDDGTSDSGEGNYTLPTATGNTITITSLPIENIPSTFPADAPDGNGTTQIQYKLNFDRQQNLVVNPFKLELTDVNITDTDNVEGSTGPLTNQNATLQYARSRPSMFFYEDISEPSVLTPIAIDVYCSLGYTACNNLGIDTVLGQINETNWWLSTGHSKTQGDGNITLEINLPGAIIEGKNTDTPTVDTDVNIESQGQDPSITVTSNATVLPMTVEVDLDESNPTDTNHWLIYNPDSDIVPPSPFYKVRFIGDSGWVGVGETGYVLENNASSRKTKRLDW